MYMSNKGRRSIVVPSGIIKAENLGRILDIFKEVMIVLFRFWKEASNIVDWVSDAATESAGRSRRVTPKEVSLLVELSESISESVRFEHLDSTKKEA
jgi:hypothetical protein